MQTLQVAFQRDAGVDSAKLNPDFRYLRVTIAGRTALLVLGYEEKDPRGPIEVWYSSGREVLRLQNGRLAGISGLPVEWRAVRLPDLPPWSSLAAAGKPFPWVRVRDVMPGYRYGVRDALTLGVAPAPPATNGRHPCNCGASPSKATSARARSGGKFSFKAVMIQLLVTMCRCRRTGSAA